MSITYLELKNRIRQDVWSVGEPRSRRTAHDHWFVDVLVEIQKYVECWQQNNTHLIPHCATHYNCGLTSFDFPRARIKRLSVIDKAIAVDAGELSEDVLLADTDQTIAGVTNQSWGGISIAVAPITAELLASYDWENANTTNPSFWKFTFNARKIANSFGVVMGFDAAQSLTFASQASNDGVNWTTLLSEDNATWSSGDTLTFAFTNTTAWLHYRIRITPTTITHPLFNVTLTQVTLSGETTSASTSYTDENDWCGEIIYDQVDPCLIRSYLAASTQAGCCQSISAYFPIPDYCLGGKGVIPAATDEGVPAGLAILPLGFHYPQESTDYTQRASRGVWAIERGRIYIAPWIQSTETVVIRWDGLKRDWQDGDLIDDDPELVRAVRLWMQKEAARDEERDLQLAAEFERQFNQALHNLWRECSEETRVRECEPSLARGISGVSSSMFYNDTIQQATANCPDNQTGDPVTVTIAVNTVPSSVSVADANQLAMQQAQAQANAQLVCEDVSVTYWNTAQSYTAECEQEIGAPAPEGQPVTITVPANSYSGTTQAIADAAALAAATALAEAQLDCTFWNSEQSYTAECPAGTTGADVTTTILASQHSSTTSQQAADSAAYQAAKQQAEADLVCDGAPPTIYYNTQQLILVPATRMVYLLPGLSTLVPCNYTVRVIVAANHYTSLGSVTDANIQADHAGMMAAQNFINLISGAYGMPCVGIVTISI